jgi:Ca-activated chloride channel family protein
MHFESPYAFLLLLLLPVLVVLRHRKGGSIRFPSIRTAGQTGRSLRQRLAFLPALVRMAALVLLIVALARPQIGLERVKDISRGIAIEMVADRSGSMGAEMEYQGERMTRLDAVKRVFKDFVVGDGRDLDGRPNDLIGMVAFARYADTVCPLTLAHGALAPFLDSVKLVQQQSEDGTSIGDALALAAARLKTAEETLARQTGEVRPDYEIKSKIIILLTDGANNAGKRSPVQAAEMAKEWGIKIYAVGVGGGDAVTTMQTPFGNFVVPSAMGPQVDEATLKAVADATGGIYRRADTAKALQRVYEEIDRLETSEIESIRFMDYEEKFVPYALAALALIVLEVFLRATVFRKIP